MSGNSLWGGFALVVAVLAGLVTAFVTRRAGHSWPEVLLASAPVWGLAGFVGASVFLSGLPAVLVGLGFLVPGVVILVSQTRLRLTQWTEGVAIGPPNDPEDALELVAIEADRADLAEAKAELRRRMRMSLTPSLQIVGVGALLGSWPVLLVGGVAVTLTALLSRYTAKPLEQSHQPHPEVASSPPRPRG